MVKRDQSVGRNLVWKGHLPDNAAFSLDADLYEMRYELTLHGLCYVLDRERSERPCPLDVYSASTTG